MTTTLIHILELLRKEDPDVVIELLELSTDMLVDAFYDRAEERIEYLRNQLQQEAI